MTPAQTNALPNPITRTSAQAIPKTESITSTPALDSIRVLGRLLDDLERERIMATNRVGALERDRGEALPHLYAIAELLQQAEHRAELELVREWRKHPLAAWAKSYRGLGEKSIARLIAEIGDPARAMTTTEPIVTAPAPDSEETTRAAKPKERPSLPETARARPLTEPKVATRERTIAQLWAYCGVGDPARIRIPKNATQEELFKRGKPRAKKQVWLIATSMLKAGNRAYYDAARAKYESRDWTDGHKHNAALRYAGKQFLKDLWLASRQELHEAHTPNAATISEASTQSDHAAADG